MRRRRLVQAAQLSFEVWRYGMMLIDERDNMDGISQYQAIKVKIALVFLAHISLLEFITLSLALGSTTFLMFPHNFT
jgi:hypothetical protein